jgi:hypothetical protein
MWHTNTIINGAILEKKLMVAIKINILCASFNLPQANQAYSKTCSFLTLQTTPESNQSAIHHAAFIKFNYSLVRVK